MFANQDPGALAQMVGDLQWPLWDAVKGEGFTHQSSGLQISSSELCGNAFNMYWD